MPKHFPGLVYDAILHERGTDRVFAENMRHAYRVDATNVARYFFTETDQEMWDITKDFPSLLPPLPHLWIEAKAPDHILSEKHGVLPYPDDMPSAWGVYCTTRDLSKHRNPDEHAHWRFYVQMVVCTPKDGLKLKFPQGFHSSSYGNLQADMNYGMGNPYWAWRFYLDDQGNLATIGEGDYFQENTEITDPDSHAFWIGPYKKFEELYIDFYNAQGETAARMLHKQIDIFTRQILHVTLMAISFMHCKNVTADHIKPEVERSVEDKRLNRWPKPQTSYHVLNIQPIRRVLTYEGNAEKNGVKRALHICRGHFANYAEGAGLFGKWHGRYWIPSHTRGTLTQGAMDKDYIVQPPQKGD